MECHCTSAPDNAEYMRRFNRKTALLRVPLTGSVDLTARCNLRCVHCYLGPQLADGPQELETDLWLSIIDEVAEAGCLYLLITGGEPFLRRDFADIYRHVRRKGIIPTVFTNGTLVSSEILGLFREYPPHTVEISLYGATAETYEGITGVRGSFAACMDGIRRLIDNGTAVKLKTILMTLNSHEFYDIENTAKVLGTKFRFDPCIFPRLNGDRSPLELRVPAGEAIEKELSDPERVKSWAAYAERYAGGSNPDSLYTCGAGVTSFHVDSAGQLKPCLMTKDPVHDLRRGGFLDGWNRVIPKIREKRPGPGYPCGRCEQWTFCSFCPAFFGLENHQEDVCSEYVCSMGELRFSRIYSNNREAG